MGIHAEVILGLDPGRDKIGFAFADTDKAKSLVMSGILPPRDKDLFWDAVRGGDFKAFVPWARETPKEVTSCFRLSLVAVGNGTYGGELDAEARKNVSCDVVVVDEHGTTLEARNLYWRLYRPVLLQRLLPQSLRVPPRPLDDLAAWAIALRCTVQ